MCVVSMIMDGYEDNWRRRFIPAPDWPVQQPFIPQIPSQQEIDEFRRLLDRAREYDKRHNEPDCELESKKQRLLDLAKELGIEIAFL